MDHPRSCGKDNEWHLHHSEEWGSPPLVRERRHCHRPRQSTGRITPARAGKTNQVKLFTFGFGDHPRSCGKDFNATITNSYEMGSPPLVRERQTVNQFLWNVKRITPARAGKTFLQFVAQFLFWDHPRSCGKDHPSPNWKRLTVGSPPLVRERPRGILARCGR